MRQSNSENFLAQVTRGQLINWCARLARISWSAEDDVSHAAVNSVAVELRNLADAVQPPQEQTVYVVVWADRHRDTAVFPFVSPEDAVRWAQQRVEDLAPDERDETLTLAMKREGWIYYCCYSREGDHLRVVPCLLRTSSDR